MSPKQPSLFDAVRTCPECGQVFVIAGSASRQRYCRRRCQEHANNRRHRERQRRTHPQLRLRVAPPVRRGAANNTWMGGVPTWHCAHCGHAFQAYRKTAGHPRRFCSWACANEAHRGGVMDFRARLRFEQCCIDELTEAGWWCLRSAGSRGPIDVFAFNATEVRLIQVKSTKDPLQPSALSLFVAAVEDLRRMPKPPAASRWLYVKILRGSWEYLNIDDLPIDRPPLRSHLRTYFERRRIDAA